MIVVLKGKCRENVERCFIEDNGDKFVAGVIEIGEKTMDSSMLAPVKGQHVSVTKPKLCR